MANLFVLWGKSWAKSANLFIKRGGFRIGVNYFLERNRSMQKLGLMRSEDDDERPERKFTRRNSYTHTHTMIVGTTEERLLRRRSNRSDMDVDWLSVEMVFGMLL